MTDPYLKKYSVVVVDEAHERTLRTDLIVGSLKKIQRVRNNQVEEEGDGKTKGKRKGKGKADGETPNPLKIVIMSATLNADKFSKFFDKYVLPSSEAQIKQKSSNNSAKILFIQGRQHPVRTFYSAKSQLDYTEAAMRTFFQIHFDQPPGDVLIFLPGQEDIESVQSSIQLFAQRLPVDSPDVSSCAFLYKQLTRSRFESDVMRVGIDMHDVRRARNLQKQPNLPSHTSQHKEMHPRHQHRRDVHHHPWSQIRHRHREV